MISAMGAGRWRVCFTSRAPAVSTLLPELGEGWLEGWDAWLRRDGLQAGTPFLIAPDFEYDVALNDFFADVPMACRARRTQAGYARDLTAFLNFLWLARDGRLWRDAAEADHVAYLLWRRRDPEGPRVSGATWDREVAAVNQFYQWAVQRGHVRANPIPQAAGRRRPAEAGGAGRQAAAQRPATYAHDARREDVAWLPPAAYRLWRDIGVRGFDAQGVPSPRFRGRWAARNSVFCDLMVRTGMRLAEQAALTVLELPIDRFADGYQQFWLPQAVAKGKSARRIYVPVSVVADLAAYAEIDRAKVVADAVAAGRYRSWRAPLVVEDPDRPVAVAGAGGVRQLVKVAELDAQDRRRLLVERVGGLEPAAFWLTEHGDPVSESTWKRMFLDASSRCQKAGVPLACHAHMLRHTFAVVTLEQLQRGHLAALAGQTADQRGHYTRIFGDPLDWVRRRLGHRSLTTTMIYLHALAELEMTTRMRLVPDAWEDPRDIPATMLAGEITPPEPR
jgi:site-specific recombinase XerD